MFLQSIYIIDLKQQNILPLQALANREHYEDTEEADENENDDIESILEEFLEEEQEEEEEVEEQEIDAVDRIQNEIAEKFDSETESLQSVQVPNPLLILLNYMITRCKRSFQFQFSCQIQQLEFLNNCAAELMI